MSEQAEQIDSMLRELEAEDQAKGEGPDEDVSPPQEWPFVLESLTFSRQDKYSGPARYESKDVGVPFARFTMNWSGTVEADDITGAIIALNEVLRKAGIVMASKVLAEIRKAIDGPEGIQLSDM